VRHAFSAIGAPREIETNQSRRYVIHHRRRRSKADASFLSPGGLRAVNNLDTVLVATSGIFPTHLDMRFSASRCSRNFLFRGAWGGRGPGHRPGCQDSPMRLRGCGILLIPQRPPPASRLHRQSMPPPALGESHWRPATFRQLHKVHISQCESGEKRAREEGGGGVATLTYCLGWS
jgi:hypothetical protein